MTTEVWFRNPQLFIREAVEVGALNWAWDIGFMLKKHIDVNRFADLYAPAAAWRQLVIGNASQGAMELLPGDTLAKPSLIHPVWEYGSDYKVLERLVESDEHQRVVVTQLPSLVTLPGKQFMRQLAELQAENPSTMIHVHGCYTYALTYGLGFGATDNEPRSDASKGNIYLPTGKKVRWEELAEHPMWAKLLNIRPDELAVPRVRCMFNIKSAIWAGEYFNEVPRFKHAFDKDQVVDDEAVDDPPLPEAQNILLKKN